MKEDSSKRMVGGLRSKVPLCKKSKSIRSQWVRKNDTLWQEIVKYIGKNRCALCSGTGKVLGHHIFAKGACGNLRHDVTNGIPLCFPCHFFKAHTNPEMCREDIISYVIQNFGTNAWEALRAKATITRKITTQDLIETNAYLEGVLKNYKLFRGED